MRLLAVLALLAVGFGAGWIFRESQPDDGPERAKREEASRTPAVTEPIVVPPQSHPSGPEPPPPPAQDPASVPRAEPPNESAAETVDGEDPDEEAKKLATFMRSMLPLMKVQSVREGRDEAAELAKLLKLDEHREKQLAEALTANKVRKLEEGVIPMLEGKEPDTEMLANLNEVDGMSGALEKDLSLILNTHELDTVKTHYREKHEADQREAIEDEVQGLAIPDLTADQERELRAYLKAEQDGGVSTSAGTSSSSGNGGIRMKVKQSISEDGILDALDEKYKLRREKLARFLSTEQLAHLDKQHEEKREEAKATAGMMGGLMGAIRIGAKTEPGKDG